MILLLSLFGVSRWGHRFVNPFIEFWEGDDYYIENGYCAYPTSSNNWEVDTTLREIKDVIFKAFHTEDQATYNDIQFPSYEVVGEALNYIAYQYGFRDRVYKRLEVTKPWRDTEGIAILVQSFFTWLGSGVVHFNDLEQFGYAWDWVETVFDKERLDMRLEQYVAEMNGSPSHIYRTEDW